MKDVTAPIARVVALRFIFIASAAFMVSWPAASRDAVIGTPILTVLVRYRGGTKGKLTIPNGVADSGA
jgi:hypothetical protein